MIGPLFLGLVVLTVAEVYAVVLVAHAIGLGFTLLLLVASSVLGIRLVRREGRRAFHAVREAVSAGRPPAAEIVDGALVLVGGVLLIIPGFITDVLGLVLLLPTRRAIRPVVMRRLHLRAESSAATSRRATGPRRPTGPPRATAPHQDGPDAGRVIDGEVVSETIDEDDQR